MRRCSKRAMSLFSLGFFLLCLHVRVLFMVRDNEDTRYIKKSEEEKRKVVLARMSFEYKSDLKFIIELFFCESINYVKFTVTLTVKFKASKNL